MNHRRIAIVALALPLSIVALTRAGTAQAATPQYYDDLMTFQTDVTFTVSDDYSNPGYMNFQSDAQMSSVLGETDYMTTGFMNNDIVTGNGTYCAGCNGSFLLSFTTTTVGTAEGVNGVGLDVFSNDMMTPYYAYITFADGDTANVQLPPAGSFWGVFAPERIASIHIGLSGGATTMGGYFEMDNLIVGDGFDMTPCGDGLTTPDEDCDDMGETASCDANCTFATCGDGTLNLTAGEICDDMGASPTCDDDCTAVECGDGQINAVAGETCDEMGETATCDTDCTGAVCGDGTVNMLAGEECDDSASSPTCDPDCTAAMCGDGFENNIAGEYCDDGNTDDGDGCSSTCTIEEIDTTSTGGESSSDSGGSSDSGTSDGGETTDASAGTSSDGGEAGSSDEAGDTSGGSLEGGSLTTTAPGESSGGGESSSGTDTAGSSDDSGGCGCTTDNPRGGAWSLLVLLGALARRRRRG